MLKRFAAACGCMILGWTGAAGPVLAQGYLAANGPTPLRFQTKVEPGLPRVALPPLPEPEVKLDLPPVPEAQAAPVKPADATMPAPVALLPVDPVVVPIAPPGEMVTPEALLKFFSRKSTNGSSMSLIAPIGFQPPVPLAPPPSSKATYKSEP
jgi:hypothetical protein